MSDESLKSRKRKVFKNSERCEVVEMDEEKFERLPSRS
jgi:hypothetical protein